MLKLNKSRKYQLEQAAIQIRKDIVNISYHSKVGHISSALCIVDILIVLYHEIMQLNTKNPLDQTRDRFILSKGHAVLGLYSVLHSIGYISEKQLLNYCQSGAELGMHPEYNPKIGIELSTGSLGHGLSVGCGLALGLKNKSRVFVLISDAELNEGSTWEAIMFAAHHNLSNLTVIVDNNSLQAFGYTNDVLNLAPLAQKWQAFGWAIHKVNGNNLQQLHHSLSTIPYSINKPSVIIANTVGGKGVSFMENSIKWHYLPLTKKQHSQAIKELNNKLQI